MAGDPPGAGPGWDGRKLVLAVVDGCAPAALERAMRTGRAPAIARLAQEGWSRDDLVSVFPSVTPACASTIATGAMPDRHRVPSMNWYDREAGRYVEYGSSFGATRQFGVLRSLTDTVYEMNRAHLAPETPTVFESLDDAGFRTAGTTYLIYRGRHEHRPAADGGGIARLATATLFRDAVMGPRELFYADLFSSRPSPCRCTLGLPGVRDQHAGCVGAQLLEEDAYDFLLLSLPDNDTWSHKHGPAAQVTSIAVADRQLERMMHAAGGAERFLETHAVIVCADHSHAAIDRTVDLGGALAASFAVLPADRRRTEGAEIAWCPAWRAAMVYVLDPGRREELTGRVEGVALATDGVDLVARRRGDELAVRAPDRGELRIAPGGDVRDRRGRAWSVEGDLAVLAATLEDGLLASDEYPDALARLWSAAACPTGGDVLVSAAPGAEFPDWGGSAHVGAGAHGSLHRSDSLGALVVHGTGPAGGDAPEAWTLADLAPLVRAHFGLRPEG